MNYKSGKLSWPLVVSLLTMLVFPLAVQAEKQLPNILIILADDMGWADPGVFGSEIETPNIDQFAKEGVRFTDFYTNPMCTPTRVTLMSGLDHHGAGAGSMTLFTAPNQQG